MGRTLYEKIWEAHVVAKDAGDTLLYVDFHLLHEASSPQAFAGLKARGLKVRRPELALAVADHTTPTEGQQQGLAAVIDPAARAQIEALTASTREERIDFLPMGSADNGIVHIVGPEQGRTRPGMVIVCGDSHTSTHGAFGALALGVGASDVEHVLATQTLRARKLKTMRVTIEGALARGVFAKDVALALLARLGAAGGVGFAIEYAGEAVRAMSMAARMTLCNMTIEAGARTGLVAPDETTLDYLRARTDISDADNWCDLRSDPDARFDAELRLNAGVIEPFVTWGTSPDQGASISGLVPDVQAERALDYMGLKPGRPLAGLPIDRVFIGSCTNARIEDLRAAAAVLRRGRVADRVRAMVVPGSMRVRREAEAEGLDRIFLAAGCEWREPGCSMCLGMNPDRLAPGERCVSTSNRNFEGRQGRGGRTHLASPATAAASAIAGAIADPRPYFV